LDKLLRSNPSTAGGAPRMHAFPTLSVPEDRIVADGDDDGKRRFQRIQFSPDGNRQTSGETGAKAAETAAEQQRMVEKKAYGEGFTDGKQAGAEESRKEMADMLHQCRRAYIELEKYRKEVYLNAEAVAVELAMAATRKLVHFEVSANPEIVIAVIRDALTRIVDQERIAIHINPADAETVNNAMETFAGVVKSTDSITFASDPGVSPGGCHIVTNFGEIDASIDTQIAMVEARLGAEFDRARIRR
jgi:flagellar biosynthesis/type III secretory pathway protein FliH